MLKRLAIVSLLVFEYANRLAYSAPKRLTRVSRLGKGSIRQLFEVPGGDGGVVTGYYLIGRNVPADERQQVEQLNSRTEQRRFFETMLEEQVGRFKREERKIRSKIRRLAKLRD